MPKKSFRRKGTKINRTRKQKMYNMKGCSRGCSRSCSKGCKHIHCKNMNCKHMRSKHMGGQGCGPTGCPLAPYSWNQMNAKGGKSMKCGKSMKGGNFYKPAAPVPAPLVGEPWTPSIKGWPGVDGVDNNRNYLSNNLYNKGDPQTMMKLGGSKKVKGGGILPQNLVNLGRDLEFNLKSVSNTLNGYDKLTSPLPYQDQFSKSSFSTNKLLI
jgi:hypothetical protein